MSDENAERIYTIEKGIPIPPPGNAWGRWRIYPVDKMDVGDSFEYEIKVGKHVRQAASDFGRTERGKGTKFVMRKMSETVGRLWRTA